MTTYLIRLVGPGAAGDRVAAALLRDVLDVLVEGARRSVRLYIEGRSTARGREPRWLPRAAAFDVVAIRKGSTVLELDAPDLEHDLPDLLSARGQIQDEATHPTSLGLFRESVEEAIAGGGESDLLDPPILETITGWKRVFDAGVERIEFGNGTGEVTSIGPGDLSRVQELKDTTPPDQRVMVVGRLNTLRHDNRMFALVLENGHTLRGVVEESQVESLGPLWGRPVLVSARAVFRPSGKVLRLEADQIVPAPSNSLAWSEEPQSLWVSTGLPGLLKSQGPRTGLNAIFGEWPGDETDQEVKEYLDEIS